MRNGLMWLATALSALSVGWVQSRSEAATLPEPARPPASCPVTQPPVPAFVPPQPYPASAPYGGFWYGSDDLWTLLVRRGTWRSLPHDDAGYRQKTFWWRPGYSGSADPRPKLRVTGRRLDAQAPPFEGHRATNAHHRDFGGWAMLVGVDVPTHGCWEITGEYEGQQLSFVVWIAE